MNINKIVLTSLVGITAVTGAFALDKEGPLDPYETVTSKAYVDAKLDEKQNNLPATNANFIFDPENELSDKAAGGSLVETNELGNPTQRGIFDGEYPGMYKQLTHEKWVPTMGAMITAISDGKLTPMTWQTTGATGKPLDNNDVAALNAYSPNFSDLANEWPAPQASQVVTGNVLAHALALKQNKKKCVQWVVYDSGTGTYTTYNYKDQIPSGASANCWLWEFDGGDD